MSTKCSEGGNFCPIPRPPRGKRGCRITQSPMANDLISHAYVMKSKGWGLESFEVGEFMELPREWKPGEGLEALSPFPILCAIHLFYLAVSELCPLIINW